MATKTTQTTEELIAKHTQTYCDKLTASKKEALKRMRTNVDKDGFLCPAWFDKDGNYTGEENPEYFTFIKGRKYLKVIIMEWRDDAKYGKINADPAGYKPSLVHCFIDKKTGDVHKAASWEAPQKDAIRYNIIEQTDKLFDLAEKSDGYAGHLYK